MDDLKKRIVEITRLDRGTYPALEISKSPGAWDVRVLVEGDEVLCELTDDTLLGVLARASDIVDKWRDSRLLEWIEGAY